MKKLYTAIRAKIVLACLGIFLSTSSFAQTDVLVCGACSPQSWLDDVVNKLIATGSFNSVTGYNIYLTGTPTLAQLQAYDAVMVFTDYQAADPTTFGDNLAMYIDGGGGVVNSTFANASVLLGGNFNTATYQVSIPAFGQFGSPQLTLGSILDPCSPIMDNVTTFNGGSSSYRSNATTFVPGSVTVSNWSNGEWLVATRTNVGPLNARRCDLNFYPPSSDVRSDFWQSSTNGATLMANALLWVAGVTNSASTPTPPASVTGAPVFCAGSVSSFTAAAVVGATSYTWTVPVGMTITSGQGTITINVNSTAQTGTVSVTANNSCGSSTPTTYSFSVNPQPTVGSTAAPSMAICNGSPITLNGTGAVSYTWSGGIFDGVAFTPPSSTSYIVTGTDANGCTNTATANVTVNPLPNVGATTTATSICAGGSVTLNGTGATSYTWSHSVIDNTPFNPTVTTTYTVTGTDANGCTDQGVVTVNVFNSLNVGSNPPSASVCNGGTVTLSGTGASSYSWSPAITNGQPFTPTVSGTYTVTGTASNGCFDTATVLVTVDSFPTVTATAPVTIACLNDASFTITGNPAGGLWTGPGVASSTFNPAGAGIGSHMLIYGYMNAAGCAAQDTIFMTVDLCLGITDNTSNNYNVYPNPNNGTFTLAINSNPGDVVIEMVDLTGRVVYSANENNVQSGFTTQIVTENLAAGAYMLRVTSANDQQVIRINVQ